MIGGIIAVVAAAFAVFFFFEHRYARKEDILGIHIESGTFTGNTASSEPTWQRLGELPLAQKGAGDG